MNSFINLSRGVRRHFGSSHFGSLKPYRWGYLNGKGPVHGGTEAGEQWFHRSDGLHGLRGSFAVAQLRQQRLYRAHRLRRLDTPSARTRSHSRGWGRTKDQAYMVCTACDARRERFMELAVQYRQGPQLQALRETMGHSSWG